VKNLKIPTEQHQPEGRNEITDGMQDILLPFAPKTGNIFSEK
jgi:hypothetical protein